MFFLSKEKDIYMETSKNLCPTTCYLWHEPHLALVKIYYCGDNGEDNHDKSEIKRLEVDQTKHIACSIHLYGEREKHKTGHNVSYRKCW